MSTATVETSLHRPVVINECEDYLTQRRLFWQAQQAAHGQ